VKLAAGLLVLLLLGAGGAAAFVWSGIYDVSATDQHLAPTYHLIKKTMERAVERRSAGIRVPPLGDAEQIGHGVALFREHCVQCHGAPAVPPERFAMGLTPLATPLARSGLDRSPGYLYWVIREGIKMTGMPAWRYRLSDPEIWAVVAFIKKLPSLSPDEYQALRSAPKPVAEEGADRAPDPERGRNALEQYACIACHEIPGLVGPEARLGPPLKGIGSRVMLAGALPNTPENMAAFLLAPAAFSPGTAMPAMGLSERDARDMAAFLATLK